MDVIQPISNRFLGEPLMLILSDFINFFLLFFRSGCVLQGKGIWMAKHVRIHEGNGRDAGGGIEGGYVRCHHPPSHRHQHLQRTLPWLG